MNFRDTIIGILDHDRDLGGSLQLALARRNHALVQNGPR